MDQRTSAADAPLLRVNGAYSIFPGAMVNGVTSLGDENGPPTRIHELMRPASLAPNDLQLQQCEPLQDLRVALALVGGAQDRFRDALNMRGMDGLGKRSYRRIKRLLHHRDHLGRKGRVGEILHGE